MFNIEQLGNFVYACEFWACDVSDGDRRESRYRFDIGLWNLEGIWYFGAENRNSRFI